MLNDPRLREEYELGLAAEQVRMTRVAVALGIALNLAFILLDVWAIPSALGTVWSIRAAMTVVMLGCLALTWWDAFPRWYSAVTAVVFMTLGGGVVLMIYVAGPEDFARDAYYGGVVLTTFGVFLLSYVRLPVSLSVAAVLLLTYTGVAVFKHGYLHPEKGIVLLVNLFFLVGATILGAVAQSVRDRYSRENYLLRHALERDVELQKEAHKRASFLADHDALTALPNRRQFDRLATVLVERDDSDTIPAVLFLDLDGFKPVNDTYGHAAGDRVLKVVAQRLREALRGEDVIARLGGDEFVICLRVAGDVAPVCNKVAKAVAAPISVRGGEVSVTASIGVAVYPHDGSSLEALLQHADEDMYARKQGARHLQVAARAERR